MNRNHGTLYLYGDSSKGSGDPEEAKVRLSFGRERRDNRSDDADWICSSVSGYYLPSDVLLTQQCNINNFATRTRCFRCQAPRTGTSIGCLDYTSLTCPDFAVAVSKAANVGDNDASPDNVPSQFLLIRGLDSGVTEEVFARGVAKLNKPAGLPAQTNSIPTKKGAKVASTTGDANLGAKDGTLRRILLVRDRRSNDSWRYGFAEYASIDDAQAALTRFNSFDRFTIASKQVLVSYIHAGVFVPELNPAPSNERFLFTPLGNPSLKLQYWDQDAYVTELVVSAPEPSGANNKYASRKPADSEGLKSTKDADKIKKRKAHPDPSNSSAKKAPASHLQFWSNRHAELHGIKKKEYDSNAPGSEASDDSFVLTQSFADPDKHCCYLCLRQFNDAAEVNKHERLSQLHRQNLKDETKVAKARAKLEKHGITMQSSQAPEQTTEYRDRAKERRKIHGVVNKKGEQVSGKPKSSHASSDDEAPAAVRSKGASLLSKMGYTAGQGLGASGDGMTAPIAQDVYVQGVGLGAVGGRVGDAVETAERNTKGDYSVWAESVKESARERYKRLQE